MDVYQMQQQMQRLQLHQQQQQQRVRHRSAPGSARAGTFSAASGVPSSARSPRMSDVHVFHNQMNMMPPRLPQQHVPIPYTPESRYLAQLQAQLQQQSQLLLLNQHALATQRREAEAAFQAMALGQLAQHPNNFGPGATQVQTFQPTRPRTPQLNGFGIVSPKEAVALERVPSARSDTTGPSAIDEMNAMSNPLVASALARRKRQSVNLETAASSGQTSRVAAPPSSTTEADPSISPSTGSSSTWERHGRSSSMNSSSTASSLIRTPPMPSDPPAFILSRPGEPFPDTSGSEGESSRAGSPTTAEMPFKRRPSIKARLEQVPTLPGEGPNTLSDPEVFELVLDRPGSGGVGASPPRASHLSKLESVLKGRRQRVTSTPPTSTVELQDASVQVVSFAPSLSPFAAAFVPPSPVSYTPSSPFFNSSSPQVPSSPFSGGYRSNRPAAVPGTASASRQPRGPPSDLNGNFATRMRRKAVRALLQGRVDRVAAGQDELVPAV
ncbi:BZ3500_MvSof-1268-A1-R1_Chr2-1g04358 [Microbotryum saponariae]|uniref:BZ3500_MvSof-1268-A1-R1_Chr2-1g04358 protein n=1 Tax=Microbotryum saponariae TaxID=289078 RepID=A0A2X0KKE7_9BASI|nr:BZ3500_MvSof-1268-A1-R1_Chr2-1g04358 [Microbotryum saponariae]SCZ91536.1 BZ3501_MvSof-1269-A2-R1_Chr2-1g04014 [Microbotryum saponariae]